MASLPLGRSGSVLSQGGAFPFRSALGLLYDCFVGVRNSLGHPLPRMPARPLPSGGPQALGLLRRRQQLFQIRDELAPVSEDHPADFVLDERPVRGEVRNDTRATRSHRLEQREAKPLGFARGEEDRRTRVDVRKGILVYATEEVHNVLGTHILGMINQGGLLGAVAYNLEVACPRREVSDRLNGLPHVLACL